MKKYLYFNWEIWGKIIYLCEDQWRDYMWYLWDWFIFPAGIYLLKVNNKNARTMCEICSKLTIKTPERLIGFYIGLYNFEHISHLALVFLLLTLNM